MATVAEVLEFLPRTDCGQCGMTCAEFAALLVSRDLSPEDCPVLHEPDYAGFIEALHELLGPAEAAITAGMLIDQDKCNGCGICVAVCEYHLGNCDEARLGRGPRPQDKVVFHVVNGTAVVVHQDLCTRLVQAAEKCNKCADHCPTGAITLF
ncbi:MAG: (Fe-S)-binding protein [Desulfobacca sp.]|nr:(Fe-S)-binding protein [Desulfobacca sp.]